MDDFCYKLVSPLSLHLLNRGMCFSQQAMYVLCLAGPNISDRTDLVMPVTACLLVQHLSTVASVCGWKHWSYGGFPATSALMFFMIHAE